MINELFTMSLHQNKALTLTITTNLNNIQYMYIVHDFHYDNGVTDYISYILYNENNRRSCILRFKPYLLQPFSKSRLNY